MKKYLNSLSFLLNPTTDDTAASAFCRPKPAATMTKNMRNGNDLVGNNLDFAGLAAS